MSLRNLLENLNIANPRDLRLRYDNERDALSLDWNGDRYTNVVPEKPFPISYPQFVLLKNAEDLDICTIRDTSRLDQESKKALDRVLEKLYFMPKIVRIVKLEAVGDRFEWETETERGNRRFTTRGRMSITFIGNKMVISDVDDNLYEIEDIDKLDEASRRTVSSTF